MNSRRSPISLCQRCGEPLSEHLLRGICSRCLARFAFANRDEPGTTAEDGPSPFLGPIRAGMVFGDYQLLEEIAHGGMGVVFKARQIGLDRLVALKVLLFGQFAGTAAFQRFRTEAQHAARLQHPNIVAIHEIGQQDGQPFYSMDYVSGRDLAEAVRDHPLSAQRAANYLHTIARAVQYAHEQGIVHRDLKPANILIDEQDQPRITDFGLARRLADEGHLTLTGQVLGSPNFMPPEQAAGGQGALSPTGDIYCLGALLYYLLTGRSPFAADTLAATLARVLNEDPLPLRRLNPGIPIDLETICLRCLEKEPRQRFPSARALAEELDRFLRGEPLLIRPLGWTGRLWRWSRRKPAIATLVAALVLALIGVAFVSGRAGVRIARERETARVEAYFSAIGLADAQIKEGKIQQALETLWRCPPELRQWEWGRLAYLCHQDIIAWQAHPTNIVQLAFEPQGRFLLSRDRLGSVKVWDWIEGQPVFSLNDGSHRAVAAAFNPVNGQLAISTFEGTLELWDTRSGQPGRTLADHQPALAMLQFSSDGRWLAAGDGGPSVRVWDAATGIERITLNHPASPVLEVAFGSSAETLRIRSSSVISWRRISTGEETGKFAAPDPDSFVFADETGSIWATIDRADRLTVWRENRMVRELGKLRRSPPQRPPRVFFSPSGRWLCAAGQADSARVWNTETWDEQLVMPERVHAVDFTRDEQFLVAIGGDDGATIWNLKRARVERRLRSHERPVYTTALSEDGRLLATADDGGTIKVWTTRQGRERIDTGSWVNALAYSPTGDVLAVGSDVLEFFSSASGYRLHHIQPHTEAFLSLGFSPDGRSLLAGGFHKYALVFDVASGEVVRRLDGHQRQLMTVAWSPHGDLLATGSLDGTVKLWQDGSDREIATLAAHPEGVNRIGFSPDGNRLCTGGCGRGVRIWDPHKGTMIAESTPETATVKSFLQCAIAGRSLAVGSFSGPLYLLDADTGERLYSWRSQGRVWDLCWMGDDQRLAISSSMSKVWGSDRGLIELWSPAHRRESLTLADCEELVMVLSRHPAGARLAGGCLDFGVYQWDAFPWDPESYGAEENGNGSEQLRRYARKYWRNRLAAESSPVASVRTNQLSFDRQRIPPRPNAATVAQVDLSEHYTGTLSDPLFPLDLTNYADNDLSELSAQLSEFAGVRFDVRGVIRTRSTHPKGHPFTLSRNRYPARVGGIRVEQRFMRLHLFHGCGGGWTDTLDGAKHAVPDGTTIARFVFHYANGTQHTEPIVYGEHLLDWLAAPDESRELNRGRVVWRGSNPVARDLGARLRLYHSVLTNPQPDQRVAHLDYESLLTACSHFVVALTVE